MEPFDVMDAGAWGCSPTPRVAAFCVWQAKQHKGARVVNEAGSVGFNGLNTRDTAGAKAFYGSVFGWRRSPSAAAPRCGRCPATASTSNATPPGLRANEIGGGRGAPGFEDVVASLDPIETINRTPSRRTGCDVHRRDADATARKATELGGKVLAGPFDAPWVRTAVIADPGRDSHRQQFAPENRTSPPRRGIGRSA
jgi:predicted enzyme related to lactoylglutathione lyase